ncbi:CsgG/HfaB family protein [Inmirania thermothiophila]|uniref:Curli production assembly/transport component CsgG n=1 Tax=Inmirania thermothiophila TaxID=1750597 RepID=A0A3N1Y4I7_9GAMM|nr:CsgG/HfaB family protein [Inmirania thermothiophila]ROR32197.1 flagellar assembly T-like protein [Inmirania thermothiophila]
MRSWRMRAGMAAALTALAVTAAADYVAYTVADGQRVPLPESIDDLDVEYLLRLEWGAYQGPKARVAVLPLENNSKASSITIQGPGGRAVTFEAFERGGGGVPVQGIEAMLTDALLKTGRFRLVERQQLDAALREQDLGASGRVAKPSAAKIGKVLGAEYLIQAVITNYESGVEQKGGGLGGIVGGPGGALLGGLSIRSSKGVVGMNFRLIDAATTEVVFSKQVEVEVKKSGLSFGGLGIGGGGALGGFLSKYSQTPIGQAVIAAIHKGVYELVKQVGAKPPTGSVIKVAGTRVYLNLGEGVVRPGDELRVLSKGEELVDPETGISLGAETEEIGRLRVVQVKKRFSIAEVAAGDSAAIKRGDMVVATRAPAPLQFAAAFEPPRKKRAASAATFENSGNN